MDTQEIQNALSQKPFKPIVLRMNDGREFLIRSSEFCAASKRDVVVMNSRGASLHLEPLLIASMEVIIEELPVTEEQASPKNGNGKAS